MNTATSLKAVIEDGPYLTEVDPVCLVDTETGELFETAVTVTFDIRTGQAWRCTWDHHNGALKQAFSAPQPLKADKPQTALDLGRIAIVAKGAAYRIPRDSWIAAQREAVKAYLRDLDSQLERLSRAAGRVKAKQRIAFEWLDSIK